MSQAGDPVHTEAPIEEEGQQPSPQQSIHPSAHPSRAPLQAGQNAPQGANPIQPPQVVLDPEILQVIALMGQTVGDAIGHGLAQARATAAPDPTKYPKAKDPTMFNGRRRKYLRTWIGENEICFRTSPNLYRSDTAKIMFAGSFLEGDAKTWFTDYFKNPNQIPAFMSDWELFCIELRRNFGLEDELGAAEEDLRRLSMSDKDHATAFTARFRAIVSNLDNLWDDRNLRNTYYQRIAPRLRSQFVSAGVAVPSRLEPLITTVERFDRAYWADFELNRSLSHSVTSSSDSPRDRKTTSVTIPRSNTKPGTTSAPRPTPTKLDQPSHLTKDGKLTDAERKRRIESGACLYCGEQGHLAATCPKRTQPRARSTASPPVAPTAQSARASTTLEESDHSDSSGND